MIGVLSNQQSHTICLLWKCQLIFFVPVSKWIAPMNVAGPDGRSCEVFIILDDTNRCTFVLLDFNTRF